MEAGQHSQDMHDHPLPNSRHQQSVLGAEELRNENELLAPGRDRQLFRKISYPVPFCPLITFLLEDVSE